MTAVIICSLLFLDLSQIRTLYYGVRPLSNIFYTGQSTSGSQQIQSSAHLSLRTFSVFLGFLFLVPVSPSFMPSPRWGCFLQLLWSLAKTRIFLSGSLSITSRSRFRFSLKPHSRQLLMLYGFTNQKHLSKVALFMIPVLLHQSTAWNCLAFLTPASATCPITHTIIHPRVKHVWLLNPFLSLLPSITWLKFQILENQGQLRLASDSSLRAHSWVKEIFITPNQEDIQLEIPFTSCSSGKSLLLVGGEWAKMNLKHLRI